MLDNLITHLCWKINMPGSLKVPTLEDNDDSETNGSFNGELAGRIAGLIGTGKNARDSFIWMTITWSFYIATGISILLFFRSFFEVAKSENLLEYITTVWSLFIPIITLALGYAFGRGE